MDRREKQGHAVPAQRLLAGDSRPDVSQRKHGIGAISDAISTSTSLSDTHRFVRLLLTDAGQGVRSVRPAHRGVSSGRERKFEGEQRVREGYVPEESMSASSFESNVEQSTMVSIIRQG